MKTNLFNNSFRGVAVPVMRVTSFLIIASLLASCAGSYKLIVPKNLNYNTSAESTGMKYSFQQNVLKLTGNKKYANREAKRPVKLIAVEITNTTDRNIKFGKDVSIFMNDRQVMPVDPSVVYHQLRQPAALYLLWGLLWVTLSKCEGDDCSTVPLPVGLVIGLGNMGVADGANKKFLAELNANNILTRDIAPGETVQGLIGVTSDKVGPITLKLD